MTATSNQNNNKKKQLQAQKQQLEEVEAAEDHDYQSLLSDWSGEEEEEKEGREEEEGEGEDEGEEKEDWLETDTAQLQKRTGAVQAQLENEQQGEEGEEEDRVEEAIKGLKQGLKGIQNQKSSWGKFPPYLVSRVMAILQYLEGRLCQGMRKKEASFTAANDKLHKTSDVAYRNVGLWADRYLGVPVMDEGEEVQ
ncbi:hypothetical protein ABG067_002120 [Albugo candida]